MLILKKDDLYDYLRSCGIPFERKTDDLSLSLIRTGRDGRIDGCMLISRRQDGDLEISYLISDEKTGGTMELFLAFKKLAMDMDWRDDNVIFTDRAGETIRFIESIASAERDSYTIKRRKTGLIIF